MQLLDKEQPPDQQQQGNCHACQTGRLPPGVSVIVVVRPPMVMAIHETLALDPFIFIA